MTFSKENFYFELGTQKSEARMPEEWSVFLTLHVDMTCWKFLTEWFLELPVAECHFNDSLFFH